MFHNFLEGLLPLKEYVRLIDHANGWYNCSLAGKEFQIQEDAAKKGFREFFKKSTDVFSRKHQVEQRQKILDLFFGQFYFVEQHVAALDASYSQMTKRSKILN